MKLGFVIQRYGVDIAGGAELHCRLVAEHLASEHEVHVFTTCAKDYVSWKNEIPAGKNVVNAVTVHRFPVSNTRNMRRFMDIQNLVFYQSQPEEMELRWIRENGPYSKKLIAAVRKHRAMDAWILFSYRYWPTFTALNILEKKAILVPTAEHDPALHLAVFRRMFTLPAAIAYNSVEERDLIHTIANNQSVPGDVVGVGLVETDLPLSGQLPEKFATHQPYILYIGRIDKNKGCDTLFRYFKRFCNHERSDIQLLLIGNPVMPIPDHPNVHHLGFLEEVEKNTVLLGSCALIMPSPYESLSMVLLEAWRADRPALVNGACEVLHGQCLRANGGIPYRSYEEFAEGVKLLVDRPDIGNILGKQGHDYYAKHYDWQVIRSKYDRMITRITQGN